MDELQFIAEEREREHARLISERETLIVNMGLHKYKLKKKVEAVMKEIEMDLVILEKIQKTIIKVSAFSFFIFNVIKLYGGRATQQVQLLPNELVRTS